MSSNHQSKYANLNLNALSNPKSGPPGSSSLVTQGSAALTRGGVLLLSSKRVKSGVKLAAPRPVNLPSIKKEHAGNDPSTQLVPSASSISGATWTKIEEQAQSSPITANATWASPAAPWQPPSSGHAYMHSLHPRDRNLVSADEFPILSNTRERQPTGSDGEQASVLRDRAWAEDERDRSQWRSGPDWHARDRYDDERYHHQRYDPRDGGGGGGGGGGPYLDYRGFDHHRGMEPRPSRGSHEDGPLQPNMPPPPRHYPRGYDDDLPRMSDEPRRSGGYGYDHPPQSQGYMPRPSGGYNEGTMAPPPPPPRRFGSGAQDQDQILFPPPPPPRHLPSHDMEAKGKMNDADEDDDPERRAFESELKRLAADLALRKTGEDASKKDHPSPPALLARPAPNDSLAPLASEPGSLHPPRPPAPLMSRFIPPPPPPPAPTVEEEEEEKRRRERASEKLRQLEQRIEVSWEEETHHPPPPNPPVQFHLLQRPVASSPPKLFSTTLLPPEPGPSPPAPAPLPPSLLTPVEEPKPPPPPSPPSEPVPKPWRPPQGTTPTLLLHPPSLGLNPNPNLNPGGAGGGHKVPRVIKDAWAAPSPPPPPQQQQAGLLSTLPLDLALDAVQATKGHAPPPHPPQGAITHPRGPFNSSGVSIISCSSPPPPPGIAAMWDPPTPLAQNPEAKAALGFGGGIFSPLSPPPPPPPPLPHASSSASTLTPPSLSSEAPPAPLVGGWGVDPPFLPSNRAPDWSMTNPSPLLSPKSTHGSSSGPRGSFSGEGNGGGPFGRGATTTMASGSTLANTPSPSPSPSLLTHPSSGRKEGKSNNHASSKGEREKGGNQNTRHASANHNPMHQNQRRQQQPDVASMSLGLPDDIFSPPPMEPTPSAPNPRPTGNNRRDGGGRGGGRGGDKEISSAKAGRGRGGSKQAPGPSAPPPPRPPAPIAATEPPPVPVIAALPPSNGGRGLGGREGGGRGFAGRNGRGRGQAMHSGPEGASIPPPANSLASAHIIGRKEDHGALESSLNPDSGSRGSGGRGLGGGRGQEGRGTARGQGGGRGRGRGDTRASSGKVAKNPQVPEGRDQQLQAPPPPPPPRAPQGN